MDTGAAKRPGRAGPLGELRERLARERVDLAGIARLLDGLSGAQRVSAVRGLGRAQQRRLYAAAAEAHPLTLADLVPPSTPDLTPVRHYGRNTLPAFTHFEKRFCRPRGAAPGRPERLFGYNAQPLQPFTGPGYFAARQDPGRPEVLIDYAELPPEHPEGWPTIRSNETGLARWVYGFLVDRLRRVSEHVSIGSAARNGRELGSWFVLCRQEGQEELERCTSSGSSI